MPTAPLYYAPYMKALYDSTKIGDKGATLATLRDQQLTYDVQLDPTGQPKGATAASPAAQAFDKDHADQSNKLGDDVIAGVFKVQQSMHAADPNGSWSAAPVARYQFATSLEGAIAGRMDTALHTNPTMLDTLRPEDVGQLANSIIDGSQQDLHTHDVRFSGDTMDVGPATTAAMMGLASGKDLSAKDAAAIADQVGREVQRTITPADPNKAGGPTDWIDEATNVVGAHWPGAMARVAQAMNLTKDITKDWKPIEDQAAQLRIADASDGPQATYVRSLKALLGAAGVDVESADAAPAAFQLLQAKPQDQVPVGIVQAILAKAKLPAEAAGYFTQRLADTGGQDGNVKGLLDSIELARRDAEAQKTPPTTSPSGTPPTGNPPTDPTPPTDPVPPTQPADPTQPPADPSAPPTTSVPGTPTVPADPSTQPPADPTTPSAPAPSTPAPDPATPAPDPSAPAPDPSAPVPDPNAPAPDPSAPAPDPNAPAPDPGTPAPVPGTPAPVPSAPDPSAPGSTPAPDPSTPAPAPSAPSGS